MKYLSNNQIQESIRALLPYNSFFCTTFLALKREGLPVNSMRRFSLDAVTKLKPRWDVHSRGDDDWLSCASEALLYVLGG
jgi:hypothetical protein